MFTTCNRKVSDSYSKHKYQIRNSRILLKSTKSLFMLFMNNKWMFCIFNIRTAFLWKKFEKFVWELIKGPWAWCSKYMQIWSFIKWQWMFSLNLSKAIYELFKRNEEQCTWSTYESNPLALLLLYFN
jgi:hypothetical protein